MEHLLPSFWGLLLDVPSVAVSWWDSLPPALWPLAIFVLRSADQTVSTVRMLVINQGRHRTAWILGLLQAFLFLGGVAGILGQLHNPWNVVAFAAGYGAGSVAGVTLEGWLAPGHAILRVVSRGRGAELVEALRQSGRGVTELPGYGRQGTVTVLLSAVPRRRVEEARTTMLAIDPKAFITIENVRVLRGGWVL